MISIYRSGRELCYFDERAIGVIVAEMPREASLICALTATNDYDMDGLPWELMGAVWNSGVGESAASHWDDPSRPRLI